MSHYTFGSHLTAVAELSELQPAERQCIVACCCGPLSRYLSLSPKRDRIIMNPARSDEPLPSSELGPRCIPFGLHPYLRVRIFAMPQGRPRLPGTDAERVEARRQQVRENVRAFRERKKQRTLSDNPTSSSRSHEDDGSSRTSPSKSGPSSFSYALQSQPPPRRVSVTRLPIDQGVKWSLGLPFRIDLGPAYSGAFIAAFNYRSQPTPDPGTLETSPDLANTPATSPRSLTPVLGSLEPSPPSPVDCLRVEICYNSWTTAVSIEAMSLGAEMLKEALLAAALSLVSLERNDRRIAAQAIQIQTVALRRLREGFNQYLNDKDPQKATMLSATALACSMSDLLVHKSWPGFSLHLKGVGALIEHASPAALNTFAAQENFLGYRTAQVSFSFLERKGSFLSRPEWIDFDWRDDHPDFSHPAHRLLDIAYQIPAQMETFDKCANQSPNALRRHLKKLNGMVSELNEWKRDLFDEYSSEIPAYSTEAANWQGLHTDVIKFSNIIVATSFTLFTGVRVALFSLVRQIAEVLKENDESAIPVLNFAIQESYKWSRISCQCLEYFFARDQNVVGRLLCLFPFDTAWLTFAELSTSYKMNMSTELDWCTATSERIKESGLPVFAIRHRD
ncbi:hypothetical protein BKA65DRAFT_542799 [Rhexocercosporidium sp. MPI-PUGE-AT-0058]|nr:hypothetical protein BKA65DRAFT_542799 [Rhexocercosporidium sp. MPI-PUGE-AT-0058]